MSVQLWIEVAARIVKEERADEIAREPVGFRAGRIASAFAHGCEERADLFRRRADRRARPDRAGDLPSVVTKDGGPVEKVAIWGRRRMSFEINKKAEGIYAVVDLQAEPATVKELDRQLNLNEAILRTKVIRPDQR